MFQEVQTKNQGLADEATGGGPARFRGREGGTWPSRARNEALLWWRVAALLVTRLAGVGRAPRGAPNPGFARKFDGGGRRTAAANGDSQNGIVPALIHVKNIGLNC